MLLFSFVTVQDKSLTLVAVKAIIILGINMRWERGRRSRNVDDRRGDKLRSGGFGGSSIIFKLLPLLLGRKGGFKLIIVIGAVIFGAQYIGIDLVGMLTGTQSLSSGGQQSSYQETTETREQAEFISVVLADTEDTWQTIFAQQGQRYQEPGLVLFTDQTNSACGLSESAMGPFYCPGDNKVYIDLSFYRDLKIRHGAPGDFAQAYVLAHEVGHHVQNLLGISRQVQDAKQQVSEAEANQLSVRLELQADCYAGLWANHANQTRQILETGDIEEALTAAAAIGDDRLQREARGRVVPESFTHGSSAQRIRWFNNGLQAGTMEACNTFSTNAI